MTTKTAISNQAIAALGVGKLITDFDTDTTIEGKTCRLFYDQARDSLLVALPWPFAKKQSALSLVANDPNDAWSYSYQIPNDNLRLIRIVPLTVGVDVPTDDEIPFRRYEDKIYCNEENAVLEHVFQNDDPSTYPPSFSMALTYLLASMIAPRISGGDNFNLSQRALQLYQEHLKLAARQSLNEEKQGEHVLPQLVRTRR